MAIALVVIEAAVDVVFVVFRDPVVVAKLLSESPFEAIEAHPVDGIDGGWIRSASNWVFIWVFIPPNCVVIWVLRSAIALAIGSWVWLLIQARRSWVAPWARVASETPSCPTEFSHSCVSLSISRLMGCWGVSWVPGRAGHVSPSRAGEGVDGVDVTAMRQELGGLLCRELLFVLYHFGVL